MAVVGTKGCKCTSPEALCKRQTPQKEPDRRSQQDPGDVQRADVPQQKPEPAEEKTVGEVQSQPITEIQKVEQPDSAEKGGSGSTKERIETEKPRGKATCDCTKPDAPCKQVGAASAAGKVLAPPVAGLTDAGKTLAPTVAGLSDAGKTLERVETVKPRGKATCDCTKPDAPCKQVGAASVAGKALAPPVAGLSDAGKTLAPPVAGVNKCVCPSEGSPCRVKTINWDICQGTNADDGKDDLETDLGALLLDEELLKDGPTVNELQASLAIIQKKCRVKDQLITALTNELQLHSKSGVFENLLSNVCTDPYTTEDPPRDFDRDQLCEFLKRPENYTARPPPHHLEPVSAEGRKVGCPPTCPGIKDCVKDGGTVGLIACPAGLKVHRRVGHDSLLLGWNMPEDGEFVGYEIYVNGVLKQKVRSPSRNKALLQNLDLIQKVVITLYGLTITGRTSEPSCVVFPDPNEPELSSSPCKCT